MVSSVFFAAGLLDELASALQRSDFVNPQRASSEDGSISDDQLRDAGIGTGRGATEARSVRRCCDES